jgi:hypothetical protein
MRAKADREGSLGIRDYGETQTLTRCASPGPRLSRNFNFSIVDIQTLTLAAARSQ